MNAVSIILPQAFSCINLKNRAPSTVDVVHGIQERIQTEQSMLRISTASMTWMSIEGSLETLHIILERVVLRSHTTSARARDHFLAILGLKAILE